MVKKINATPTKEKIRRQRKFAKTFTKGLNKLEPAQNVSEQFRLPTQRLTPRPPPRVDILGIHRNQNQQVARPIERLPRKSLLTGEPR